VGTPSNDWYGGRRKGDNLFAESIVCLNAETGERVWHFQAVRHGLFTILAAAMLALGIGANTAIFSVVNAVVLQPLSYHAPEGLFFVGAYRGGRLQSFSAPEFLALREQARGFEEVAAAIDVNLNLVGEGEPERVAGACITANLLPLLGVEPYLGRNFLPEEEREGKDAVVLVAYGAWGRRFGSDPGLIGRTLTLDGREHEIVGILPEGSLPLDEAELLVGLEVRDRDRQRRLLQKALPTDERSVG
jgi:hypothetical protein